MVLQQPLFGKGPKYLQSIDVPPSLPKFFPMIHCDVLAVIFQRFIRFKLIRVEHTPLFSMLSDRLQKGLCGNIIHHGGKDFSLALKHPENLHLPSRTTTSRPPLFTSEIAFIALYFTRQLLKLFSQIPNDLIGGIACICCVRSCS